MTWNSFSNNEDDVIEINEDNKILRKFKKAENFNELNAVVKEKNDYESMKYESDEKKVQDEDRKIKNLIVLNDQEKNIIMHYLYILF